MAYNQGMYRDYNNTTSDYTVYFSSGETIYDKSVRENAGTVSHSGSNTFSSSVALNGAVTVGSSGTLKVSARALTTATTGTALPQVRLITVSSTKTVKSFTAYGTTVGTEMTIHCKNASATGYIQVSVDSSAGAGSRTFDGTNYLYQFKKAGESIRIQLVSTGRWFEIGRTVSNGTALNSTTT